MPLSSSNSRAQQPATNKSFASYAHSNNCESRTLRSLPTTKAQNHHHHTMDAIMSSNRSSFSKPSTPAMQSPTRKSPRSSFVEALKKPFKGWSKELLAAKDHLDDEYNFPRVPRRGEELAESECESRRGSCCIH